MSIVRASGSNRGICVTCASPGGSDLACVRALACPASSLAIASVAGAFFALVLFSLVTLNVPYELICILLVQLISGNGRMLARSRQLAMLVAPLVRVCHP